MRLIVSIPNSQGPVGLILKQEFELQDVNVPVTEKHVPSSAVSLIRTTGAAQKLLCIRSATKRPKTIFDDTFPSVKSIADGQQFRGIGNFRFWDRRRIIRFNKFSWPAYPRALSAYPKEGLENQATQSAGVIAIVRVSQRCRECSSPRRFAKHCTRRAFALADIIEVVISDARIPRTPHTTSNSINVNAQQRTARYLPSAWEAATAPQACPRTMLGPWRAWAPFWESIGTTNRSRRRESALNILRVRGLTSAATWFMTVTAHHGRRNLISVQISEGIAINSVLVK